MKKIITICSLIMALAIIVTAFTACGDNTEKETTTDEPIAAGTDFIAEINKTETVIKKDGEVYQTLEYPKNSGVKFDKKYAEKHNAFIDMNFDGKKDFYIAVSSVDGVISFYCWLYNDTSKIFEYSELLSALKNISVDADNHRILSDVMVDGEKHVFSYKWVDGQLILDSDYSDDNGGIPEEVTKVVTNNAIGTQSTTSSKPGKEETTKKNSSDSNKTTTKVNKPANTTTTTSNNGANNNSNNGGAVVLETGSLNSDGWY